MNVQPTLNFFREAKHLVKKYPSLKREIGELEQILTENPTIGISIGKNCYKIRLAIASKGKGKNGGGRVITCVKIVSETVYLLSIYDKSEKSTVNDSEQDDLLKDAGLSPES